MIGLSFVWKVVSGYSIVHSAVRLGGEVRSAVTEESTPVCIHKMQQSRDVSSAYYRCVVRDVRSYEQNP